MTPKTFKMTVTFTVSNEEALAEMMWMKNQIQSGEMQREFTNEKTNKIKIDKAIATFEEIKK
jgi:hypothetical protein